MKKILVAFDVDGTLISNGALAEHEMVANERIRSLLIIMAHMKNTRILVWSGGGELWARQAVAQLGLQKYVDEYADKQYSACTRPECVAARKGGTYATTTYLPPTYGLTLPLTTYRSVSWAQLT